MHLFENILSFYRHEVKRLSLTLSLCHDHVGLRCSSGVIRFFFNCSIIKAFVDIKRKGSETGNLWPKIKAFDKLNCLMQISCKSDFKQESYCRLKILKCQAGYQKISEVVTSLAHSGYWFFFFFFFFFFFLSFFLFQCCLIKVQYS